MLAIQLFLKCIVTYAIYGTDTICVYFKAFEAKVHTNHTKFLIEGQA